MEIKELIAKTQKIRDKYVAFETDKYGKEWTNLNLAQGLVGDVGDLVKVIMAKEGIRKMEDIDKKLEHEIIDCLYTMLVLAGKYKIDIEKAFLNFEKEVEEKIK